MTWWPSADDLLNAVLGAPEALANWFRPKHRRRHKVAVPQFKGLLASQAFLTAAQAGVRLKMVRLLEPPDPVDGLVLDQTPPAGTIVRQGTVVTLSVIHEDGR